MAVVVLTWNGVADTVACLQSLRATITPPLDVIVTDNNSSDETVHVVRDRFPEVTLIENGENLGFAGGNNAGIALALERGAAFVLVLNNDTEVPGDAIARLVGVLDVHPEAAAVSPVMPYLDEPSRLWFAGSHYDPLKGHAGRNSAYELGRAPLPDAPLPVDRAVGAAMLVRSEVIASVGAFDPALFYLHEDVDWSLRMREAGWSVLLDPTTRIPHRVAASQGGAPQTPVTAYYGTRNDLEMGRRYGPRTRLRRGVRQVGSFAIHLAAARGAAPGQRLACVRASIEGARDHRARRLGPRQAG